MRVAVTGATGFVGPHLLRELGAAGHEPVAVSNMERADLGVPFVSCDLTRSWPAELEDVDAVVHLAGLSAVGPSFDQPQRYLDVNGSMVTTMCETLRASGSRARVLVVSTGAVYDAFQDQPIPESGTLATNSPYVVSKLLVENLAAYYAGRGLDVVVARPFNHLGPGQGQGFLLPDLVAEAGAAAAEGRGMRTGDLGTARDYTDVRDVARAYRLLVEADLGEDFTTQRVFNICSGRPRPGTELCELALAELGLGDLAREVDPARIRPNDPHSISGDNTRLRETTGWTPERGLEETVHDYVEDRFSRLGSS
jgi:GDP-4-dehydro-6-deoxy-D-mannose reductase